MGPSPTYIPAGINYRYRAVCSAGTCASRSKNLVLMDEKSSLPETGGSQWLYSHHPVDVPRGSCSLGPKDPPHGPFPNPHLPGDLTVAEAPGPELEYFVPVKDSPGSSYRQILPRPAKNGSFFDPRDEPGAVKYDHEMYYVIQNRRLKNARTNLFVDDSRDSALAFSKDIALGLLDHIVDELAKRDAESRDALRILEVAAEKIRADQEAARAAKWTALGINRNPKQG